MCRAESPPSASPPCSRMTSPLDARTRRAMSSVSAAGGPARKSKPPPADSTEAWRCFATPDASSAPARSAAAARSAASRASCRSRMSTCARASGTMRARRSSARWRGRALPVAPRRRRRRVRVGPLQPRDGRARVRGGGHRGEHREGHRTACRARSRHRARPPSPRGSVRGAMRPLEGCSRKQRDAVTSEAAGSLNIPGLMHDYQSGENNVRLIGSSS